jgi:hypothetical protein
MPPVNTATQLATVQSVGNTPEGLLMFPAVLLAQISPNIQISQNEGLAIGALFYLSIAYLAIKII